MISQVEVQSQQTYLDVLKEVGLLSLNCWKENYPCTARISKDYMKITACMFHTPESSYSNYIVQIKNMPPLHYKNMQKK